MNKFEKIRFHYYINQDAIIEAYPKCLSYGYIIKNEKDLTPIENRVFESIQFYNLPLLPQYPIKKYFVDFGDPIKKIAIEVDGEKFHLDKKKDAKRQNEIEHEGWSFYRIKGKYTYYPIHEYFKFATGNDMELTDNEEVDDFILKHINFNSDCLISHLRKTIYRTKLADENTPPNMIHIFESLDRLTKRLEQREKRKIEWEKMYGKIDK